MATFTKPLVSAAALATAAAVAVATPVIAPSITASAPTPAALSAAKVQLTTFADLLSITPSDWVNYYFIGWGGAIGPINVGPDDTNDDYWLPECNYDCLIPGIPGVAYLALDALINGNGGGLAEAPEWGVSALNYFFEGTGPSPGVQYVLQQPFAPGAPLENPQIFEAIKLAFQIGSGNLWLTAYLNTLSTIAVFAAGVPLVGEYIYRGIGSYIGPAFQTIDTFYDYDFYAGLSGVLRYVGGVITTPVTITEGPLAGVTLPIGNPNPFPTVAPEPGAAVNTVTANAVASSAVTAGTDAGSAADLAPAKVEAVTVAADTSAETAPADSTPASTPTVADTTPVDSPSAAVAESTAEAPAATEPAEAPSKSAKRPVRGALERAAKKVGSALGVSKADSAKADSAKPDSAKADSAKADSAKADSAPSASAGAATASSDADSADSAG
jgi:hypothetical protein